MSIQPPSATEFLAMPSDPDEEETAETYDDFGNVTFRTPDHPLGVVLEVTAASLLRIANALEDQGDTAVESHNPAACPVEQEYADLEAKHELLFGLLADVEKLVSKSTSKLANSVRDAITAWKTGVPEVPSEVVAELTPEVAAVVEEVAAANDADLEGSGDDDHNHTWARTVDGVLVCECGAWIDNSDPDHPQGIVREPGYESDPNA